MSDKLLLVPLGGMGEIGKNMFVYQYRDEIVVVDAGLKFPEDEMFGVDYVIPNITYLLENQAKVKAIFLTHGHEDHIGALPYVLKQLPVPVYGTRLTIGLLKIKLDEHNVSAVLKEVKAGEEVKIGSFQLTCFHVNHSIPDSIGLAIKTPVGTILHTGDFKLDQTPVDGKVTDYFTLTRLGNEGVLGMLSDSTNAHRPGYTKSERDVGKVFEDIFGKAKGRLIVASFASNIHRIQQVFDTAVRFRRKVAVVGRSMIKNVEVATELGYLTYPDSAYVEIEELDKLAADRIVIVSTGSQGEPLSGLTRMAAGSHPRINIVPGDTVIFSSTPVPGNEKLVSKVIDSLSKAGARVIYQGIADVHVSGHASREELKILINMTRPKFMVPCHGEYRHQAAFSDLAQLMGYDASAVLSVENGQVVEFTPDSARVVGSVTAGSVLVDGIGVGDVGNVVLRDRQQLAADGVMVVAATVDRSARRVIAGPDIISRGFVYVKESEGLLSQAELNVSVALHKALQDHTDWVALRNAIREPLANFLYEKTRRRPMILPVLLEANRN
ncbi:MAG: Ribonuclease J1 [Firmicutes bacterium]|nr:Ribonuclease J1 [candidate division NPL-UPA2 bacterium]